MTLSVKVEIVGFLPTLYTTICKSYCNPTGVAGVKATASQLEEYPASIRDDQIRASDLYRRITSDFPGQVEVRAVNSASLRGLWLALKHGRRGTGLWLVLNGRRTIDARADYDSIRTAIAAEVQTARRIP